MTGHNQFASSESCTLCLDGKEIDFFFQVIKDKKKKSILDIILVNLAGRDIVRAKAYFLSTIPWEQLHITITLEQHFRKNALIFAEHCDGSAATVTQPEAVVLPSLHTCSIQSSALERTHSIVIAGTLDAHAVKFHPHL